MSVVDEIRERSKKLRGTDTDGLLSKIYKETISHNKAVIGYMKRKERRELFMFRGIVGRDGGGGNVNNIYNTSKTVSNSSSKNLNIKNGMMKVKDDGSEKVLKDVKSGIISQTKDLEKASTQQTKEINKGFVSGIIKATIVRSLVSDFKDFIFGNQVLKKQIHAINNVERAIRGQDSQEYSRSSPLLDMIDKIMAGQKIQLSEVSNTLSTMFDISSKGAEKIDDFFGNKPSNMFNKLKNSFNDSRSNLTTGFKDMIDEMNRVYKEGGSGADGVVKIFNTLKDTLIKQGSKSMKGVGSKIFDNKFSKDFLLGITTFFGTDMKSKIIGKLVASPLMGIRTAYKLTSRTLREINNAPLYQAAAVMHEFGGMYGVAGALLIKTIGIVNRDVRDLIGNDRLNDLKSKFRRFKDKFKSGFSNILDTVKLNARNVFKFGRRSNDEAVDSNRRAVRGISKFYHGVRKGIQNNGKKIYAAGIGLISKIVGWGLPIITAIGTWFLGLGTFIMSFLKSFALRSVLGVLGAAWAGWSIGSWLYEKFKPEIDDFVWNTVQGIKSNINSVTNWWHENVTLPISNMIDSMVSFVKRGIAKVKKFILHPIDSIWGSNDGDVVETPQHGSYRLGSTDPKLITNQRSDKSMIEEFVRGIDRVMLKHKPELVVPSPNGLENERIRRMTLQNAG